MPHPDDAFRDLCDRCEVNAPDLDCRFCGWMLCGPCVESDDETIIVSGGFFCNRGCSEEYDAAEADAAAEDHYYRKKYDD